MPSASYLLTNSSQPAPTQTPQRWPANSLPDSSALLTWLPIALFLGIFALESTRQFGSDHTSAPLHHLARTFFGTALDEIWPLLHHILRKTGHFLGYGSFSLFAYRAAAITLKRRIANALQRRHIGQIIAIAATAVVASADEIHQCFLPNRTGCVSDVLLDTAGAVTLQMALVALFHFTRSHESLETDLASSQTQSHSSPGELASEAAIAL